MKYVKFIAVNIIAFIVFFWLLSLLFPNKTGISKTVNIVSTKSSIAATLQDTDNWKTWNEFAKADTIFVEKKFANTDSVVMLWRNTVGSSLTSVFRIIGNNSDSTILNFELIQQLKWYQPLQKFAAIFAEKKLGPGMEISLNNLKQQLESTK
jgi:hypothetical protein